MPSLAVLLLAGLWFVADRLGLIPASGAGSQTAPESPATPAIETVPAGTQTVLDAHRRGRSDVQVKVSGRIVRTLADDQDGDRHQRFVLRLDGADHTVLVAHNLDLAPRVPLAEGDAVVVHGEYESNEQGGVLHWTHHDPAGRHPDGWIEHAGKTYR